MTPAATLPLFSWSADVCANKHKGNAESEAANRATNKSRDRGRILSYLHTVQDATCDEIEQALGMSHQTASARFSDLKASGEIVQGNGKRPTRTGCLAQAWKLSDGAYFAHGRVEE